ncbi:hypothetical protein I6N91_10660 [Arthrobacter sp. MSA 4-2]|uniref:hypothetical protein n=1 Tax=Arthrobacter sp. MSA 4-2 TaxID=2794349 RepID=UPI0018E8117D|nr:hypothetical protein [Arthrobacter sp. MSA 4-2]MBJ2121440.1 hypothetical protein [Arthrobacter sp. MSA 4-2]
MDDSSSLRGRLAVVTGWMRRIGDFRSGDDEESGGEHEAEAGAVRAFAWARRSRASVSSIARQDTEVKPEFETDKTSYKYSRRLATIHPVFTYGALY